jgi:Poly(3-hydroxyalkanoate) synthetase
MVEQGHLTWDDYLTEGIMRAIDVAREITGSDKVNALGFLRRRHDARLRGFRDGGAQRG